MRFILVIVFFISAVFCQAQNPSARRAQLDSMNQSIKKQMQHLDSTVLRMDRLMDSITDKQERKIDTMALYLRMAEEARKSHQQEYWIWRIGLIIILIVGVASVWRWKIFKRKNRID